MKSLQIHSSCQIPNLAEIYSRWLNKDDGQFVEVGAFDGFVYSNTYCLAEIGWSGLCIEPLPSAVESFRKYHANHPKVKVLQMAASDTRLPARLYTHGEVSSLVMDQNSHDWGCRPDRFIDVECDLLDNILASNGISPGFDLLVIDVEGAEIKVLQGFSIDAWKPSMVIIEAHELDKAPIRNWKAGPINAYFEKFGYVKIQADHINSIFINKRLHDASVLGAQPGHVTA